MGRTAGAVVCREQLGRMCGTGMRYEVSENSVLSNHAYIRSASAQERYKRRLQ